MKKYGNSKRQIGLVDKIKGMGRNLAIAGALAAGGIGFAQNTQLNVPEYGVLNEIAINQYIDDHGKAGLAEATGLTPAQVDQYKNNNWNDEEIQSISWNLKDNDKNTAIVYVGLSTHPNSQTNDIGGSTNKYGQRIVAHEVPTKDIVDFSHYINADKLQMSELLRIQKEFSTDAMNSLKDLARNGINTKEKIDSMTNLLVTIEDSQKGLESTLTDISANMATKEQLDSLSNVIDSVNQGYQQLTSVYKKDADNLSSIIKMGKDQGLTVDQINAKVQSISESMVNDYNALNDYLHTALDPVNKMIDLQQQILAKSNSLDEAVSAGNAVSGQIKTELNSLDRYVKTTLGPVTEYINGLNQELAGISNMNDALNVIDQYTKSNTTKLDSINNATATANEKLGKIDSDLENLLKEEGKTQQGVQSANAKLDKLLANQNNQAKQSKHDILSIAGISAGYNLGDSKGLSLRGMLDASFGITDLSKNTKFGASVIGNIAYNMGGNADFANTQLAVDGIAGPAIIYKSEDGTKVIATLGIAGNYQSQSTDERSGDISGTAQIKGFGPGAGLKVLADKYYADVFGSYTFGNDDMTTEMSGKVINRENATSNQILVGAKAGYRFNDRVGVSISGAYRNTTSGNANSPEHSNKDYVLGAGVDLFF